MAKTSMSKRVPAMILTSPLNRLLSGERLVLGFTGRRGRDPLRHTGELPARRTRVLVTTDSGWWRNFDGGAPVELRLRGRVAATARAVCDPDDVAEALTALVRGIPDAADVEAEVARGRVLVRVCLPEGAAP